MKSDRWELSRSSALAALILLSARPHQQLGSRFPPPGRAAVSSLIAPLCVSNLMRPLSIALSGARAKGHSTSLMTLVAEPLEIPK